mgnify:CR=1 FL=1
MSRKDREVTDPQRIEEIIAGCTCCRLGLCDGGSAYIVPLSFGYTRREDGGYTLYFHGAREGRKIDLIRRTGRASFEMDTGYQLRPGEAACSYSAAFRSVMGEGPVSFVEDAEEKRRALDMIMLKNTGRGGWEYSEKMLDAVCVFSLTVDELACKEHE